MGEQSHPTSMFYVDVIIYPYLNYDAGKDNLWTLVKEGQIIC